jgi:DNA-binding protein H-NS
LVSNNTIRLSNFNIKELEGLQNKIEKEIKKRRSKIQEEGLKKIKLIAAEYGLSASELKNLSVAKIREVRPKTGKKRGPIAPKYRDPSNSANTWTGRGRKPKWVEAFLSSGGRLDQIII